MARVHPEIYFFGAGVAEGRAEMRDLLGGKGANLAEMATLKLPVPPGFTISTGVCNYFYEHESKYPEGLEGRRREKHRAHRKGARPQVRRRKNPLLVSVRSGARVSMPGMMDTVLNLGLTDETVEGLEEVSGNPRFAWDSYRRFCQMYGDVVLKLKPENKNDRDPFEELIEQKKAARGVSEDVDLSVEDLKELVGEFRDLIRRRVGRDIPQDPHEQLWEAIGAVFGSWNNDRAVTYRKINNIPGDWGTAVTVQSMVFGNLGPDCATGVAFTRDPSTGEKRHLRRVPAQCAGRGRGRRHPHTTANQSRRGHGMGRSATASTRRNAPRAFRRWKKASPPFTRNCSKSRSASKSISTTCRTWSSPSSADACSCCKRVTANAPPKPPFAPRSRWPTKS